MTSSTAAREYARAHANQFLAELIETLRIPSLSADPAHADDIRRMADWYEAHLKHLGLQKVAVMPTAGHPVVYGEWLGAGPDKPTVLVYGHYDVVPALTEDGWETDPFKPVQKDGKIFLQETEIALADLSPKLQAIAKNGYEEQLFVRADTNVSYGMVMEVMGLFNSAGYRKIGLVTSTEDKAASAN